MGLIPVGRMVTAVAYYTLADPAWEQRPGLHDLDFGLDLELGGDVVGIVWAGTLEVVQGSLRTHVPTALRSDVSSVEPWGDIVGSRLITISDLGTSILRLRAESGRQIWLVAGNYLPAEDGVIVGGDSVLVIHDNDAARRWDLG